MERKRPMAVLGVERPEAYTFVMKKGSNHAWDVTPKEAIEIQKKLRESVVVGPFLDGIEKVKYIAGADVSMNMFSNTIYAGFVVMTYPGLEVVDESVVKTVTKFPYIPGLLSFREIPALLMAWKKLHTKPDLIVVDGVGIAHPRRIGIASHLGVVLDIPTIGSSKSVLVGEYDEPGIEAGSISYMHDPKSPLSKKEVIGIAYRSKKKVKPIFVSPGHQITLEESLKIISNCIRKHRLPEPIRFAHDTMNRHRMAANQALQEGRK
jgi:deoxyribonuclease V